MPLEIVLLRPPNRSRLKPTEHHKLLCALWPRRGLYKIGCFMPSWCLVSGLRVPSLGCNQKRGPYHAPE